MFDPAASTPRPRTPAGAGETTDKAATRALVASGATLTGSYFIMNAAATLIAGYGLLANSVAVVPC